jgi:hypothetical protein
MVACLSPFESNYLDRRASRKRHAGDPIRFDIRPVTIKNKQLAVRHEHLCGHVQLCIFGSF